MLWRRLEGGSGLLFPSDTNLNPDPIRHIAAAARGRPGQPPGPGQRQAAAWRGATERVQDRMRPVSASKVFQASQQASMICAVSAKTR